MITLALEADPGAVNLKVDCASFTVCLADGRTLTVPVGWYPRLHHASSVERNHWQLIGNGYAIEWPDLDEHIGVEGLSACRRSGESEYSFQRWLSLRR